MERYRNIVISALSLEGKKYTGLVWACVFAFFLLIVFSNIVSGQLSYDLLSLADICVFIIAIIHGIKRYKWKQLLLFFALTWITSNTFESLSIYMGFPFGYYNYTSVIPGPFIFNVPILIMPTYFGMGYMAYILSHVLNNQFSSGIRGFKIFTIPLIGTFIMVMWDLVMDPIATNIQNAWIWREQGPYFNIPLSNYFGWFLVVYIFLQLFTIINKLTSKNYEGKEYSKLFWLPAAAIIGMQGINYLIQGFIMHSSNVIFSSTGLISLFTLCFVSLLSLIVVAERKSLK